MRKPNLITTIIFVVLIVSAAKNVSQYQKIETRERQLEKNSITIDSFSAQLQMKYDTICRNKKSIFAKDSIADEISKMIVHLKSK